MFAMDFKTIILGMAACLFVLGVISIGAGIVILISKVMGGDVQALAQETSKLAQKGVADDISGIVGNASILVDALNQLVRTAAGVGIFLVLTGLALSVSAYFIIAKMI